MGGGRGDINHEKGALASLWYLTHLLRPCLPQRRRRSPPPLRRSHHPQPFPYRRFLPRCPWLSRRLVSSLHSLLTMPLLACTHQKRQSEWARGVPALSFAPSMLPSSSTSPSWESLLRSPFPASPPSPFSSPCQALPSQSRQTSTYVCPVRKPAPTHQHLSATVTEMKPSACTCTDTQAYAHAFSDP